MPIVLPSAGYTGPPGLQEPQASRYPLLEVVNHPGGPLALPSTLGQAPSGSPGTKSPGTSSVSHRVTAGSLPHRVTAGSGAHRVSSPPGPHRVPTGSHPCRVSTGSHTHRVTTGSHTHRVTVSTGSVLVLSLANIAVGELDCNNSAWREL